MTEPINLPPLPDPFVGLQHNSGWNSYEQVISSAIGEPHVISVFTEGQMQAYATAAIEADRQARITSADLDLATEIWAAAQTAPGEGIEDAENRIVRILAGNRQARRFFMGVVLSDQEINQLQMQANVMPGDPTGFHRIARLVEKATIKADRKYSIGLIERYQERVRALEAENYAFISELDDRKHKGEPVAEVTVNKDRSQTWIALKTQWLPEGKHLLYTAPQPQQQARGEPVAWEFSHNGYWTRTSEPEMHKQMGRPVRPLYTAPQPQKTPEGYKLVPIEPTSKQICLMALEIQGVNEKGVCRTDDPRWPESVAKAEAAYKTMLEAAPPPVEAGDQNAEES